MPRPWFGREIHKFLLISGLLAPPGDRGFSRNLRELPNYWGVGTVVWQSSAPMEKVFPQAQRLAA